MKTSAFLLVLLLCVLSICESKDLILGTSFNTKLMLWQEKVEYNAIPLNKRVKEVFYSDPEQKVIKGIILRDLGKSEAVPSVTAGGVGSTFVNIRLKSERGSGLNYHVELYA